MEGANAQAAPGEGVGEEGGGRTEEGEGGKSWAGE